MWSRGEAISYYLIDEARVTVVTPQRPSNDRTPQSDGALTVHLVQGHTPLIIDEARPARVTQRERCRARCNHKAAMTVPWSKRGARTEEPPKRRPTTAEAPKRKRKAWLSIAFAPLAAAVRAALRSFLDESDTRLQLSIEEGERDARAAFIQDASGAFAAPPTAHPPAPLPPTQARSSCATCVSSLLWSTSGF